MEPTAITRLLLRPHEAAEVAAVSRSTIYAAIASGELASVKLGASRRVRPEALRDWIAREAEGVGEGVGNPLDASPDVSSERESPVEAAT